MRSTMKNKSSKKYSKSRSKSSRRFMKNSSISRMFNNKTHKIYSETERNKKRRGFFLA